MPTSSYQPSVAVEIAWNAGYSTPAASRTWTDVSQYVELDQNIGITYGRQDEFATADANRLTLTLDNSDGRFTANRAASPYYPNVKIGRPIRVTSTPVGGTPSVRYVGYVDEWPVEWDGTDNYAKAVVTASSRIARLGFDAELRSIVQEVIIADDPAAYYALDDEAGALVAADSSAHAQPSLTVNPPTTAVVFGSALGPSADGVTAAVLAGGSGALSSRSLNPIGAPGAFYFELFFSTATTPAGAAGIVTLGSGLGAATFYIAPTGQPHFIFSVGDAAGGLSVCDGLAHHIACVYAGTTISLYVDGALAGTDTISAGLATGFTTVQLINNLPQDAILSNFALGTAISPTRVAAHSTAGSTSVESAASRIGRLAAIGNIPAAEYAGDAGTNPVSPFDTAGSTAIAAMRTVEETESGVLYDARDNTLTFRGRAARYNTTSGFTLSTTLQQVESDVAPKLDRSALVNDVTATAIDGTTARAINPASISDYGSARATPEIASTNDAAYQAASWQVNTYGTPAPRIPSLGVDLLPLGSSAQASLLAADIGTRFTAAGLPSQASALAMDFFIEGYTETIGTESYRFSFNVSPVTGFDVWTCEDPVRGIFDTNPIAL